VIEPETAATLSKHPNIIGMKDSAADLVRFTASLSLAEEQFAVITGNGTMLFDAFRAGARGAILAVGCVAWQSCLQIVEAMTRGDLESARSLQVQLTPLALAVTKRYGIGGLKAAMDSINLVGGAVRSPLIRPGVEAREEITDLLRAVVGEGRQDPAGRAGVVTT
jgi:4-hydroxy-2-oxoglutarate aldolase